MDEARDGETFEKAEHVIAGAAVIVAFIAVGVSIYVAIVFSLG